MATRVAERRATDLVDVAPGGSETADLLFRLVDSLKQEQAERKALLTRLRASVEEGNRQLAALGIALPAAR